VTGLRTDDLTQSLEDQNLLRFSGLSTKHYIFLTVTILFLLASVGAILVCVFSYGSRKLLWVLLILIGVGNVRFNWTTGEQRYALLTLPQLPSVQVSQESPYAPWYVSMGFPIGVVLFVLHRRRLKRGPAPAKPKAKPAPAPVPAAPPPPEPEPQPEPLEPSKEGEPE